MKTEILYCQKCSEYTLSSPCTACSSNSTSPKPAKFSLQDPYGRYRRLAKKQQSL